MKTKGPRELLKDEPFIMMEMWNGQMASVPAGAAKEFQERQEMLKRQKQKEKSKENNDRPNFDEAIRATEDMFKLERLEQSILEKETKIKQLTDDIHALRTINGCMQENIETLSKKNEEYLIAESKMKIAKKRKTHALTMIYIFIFIIELFFCVPYNNIQIFLSKQGVPHTEIVGSGYSTIFDIASDDARIRENYINSSKAKPITNYGKTINTPLLCLNVLITSLLAVGAYFRLKKKENKIIEDNISIPMLDINGLALADDETQKAELNKFVKQIIEIAKTK